jgi:hypothetical protein
MTTVRYDVLQLLKNLAHVLLASHWKIKAQRHLMKNMLLDVSVVRVAYSGWIVLRESVSFGRYSC